MSRQRDQGAPGPERSPTGPRQDREGYPGAAPKPLRPRLVGVKGLSEYLGDVSVATLYSWKSVGRIPARCVVKWGGLLRFDLDEIDKVIDDLKAGRDPFQEDE